MKILLIKEPANILRFPPIGLLYLAAAIRQSGNHTVRIIDAVAGQLTLAEVGDIAIRFQPDVIGATVYSSTLYDSVLLARKIRAILPETRIVWGGPHTDWFAEESLRLACVDYVIRGEAEHAFGMLCDALELHRDLSNIPGLVMLENGRIRYAAPPDVIRDLDAIPLPAFECLDIERYPGILGVQRPLASIGMSRGCPFQCTFCAKTDSSYRRRSVGNVLEEMARYYERGFREFFFFDELFNLTAQHVKDFSTAVLRTGWHDLAWSFRGRVDAVDEEMLNLAARAGCRCIFYGIEAATDEGLRGIEKQITMAQARQAVSLTRQAGIMAGTNWIIGLPSQRTRNEVLQVCDAALSLRAESVQFSILRAYHGTKIFQQGVELGLFDPDLWKTFARNPTPEFLEPVWEQYFSRQELEDLLKTCYRQLSKAHNAKTALQRAYPFLTPRR